MTSSKITVVVERSGKFAQFADVSAGASAYEAICNDSGMSADRLKAADLWRGHVLNENDHPDIEARAVIEKAESAAEKAATEGWADRIADSGLCYIIDSEVTPETIEAEVAKTAMSKLYEITADNSQALYFWGEENDVERYVDWLNRDRDINVYHYSPIPEAEWGALEERDDVLIATEPHWDDFMDADDAAIEPSWDDFIYAVGPRFPSR